MLTEAEKRELAALEASLAPPQATSPSGGLSREEQAELMALEQSLGTSSPKEKDAWYEDFGEGLAVSGMGTYYGIKDLFGKMTDEDRATLEDWKRDASESGWGTAGQVVGEIGQTIMPAGAVLKGARALNMGKNALRAAGFGGDVATSATLGGLQSRAEGEDFTSGAAQGAAGAAAGGALGAVLGKAVRGISKTDEAQKLLDEGIELTPAQASAGQLPKALESVMEYTKFLSGGTTAARQKALSQWNQKVLNEAAPEGYTITATGNQGFAQLDDAINKSYDDAWRSAIRPPKRDFSPIRINMSEQGARLDSDSQLKLRNVWREIDELRNDWTPERLRTVDRNIREDIQRAADDGNRPLMELLKETRQGIRDIHGPDVQPQLMALDKKYDQYLTVLDASNNKAARESEGIFTPQMILHAGAKQGRRAGARGETPLEQTARTGMRTVGQEFPAAMWDTRRALATLSPSPQGLMQRAGRVVLGETPAQRHTANIASILRKYGLSGATLGGAWANAQE